MIAIIVTMAPFMEILDTTIVNVSLPHIAGALSASYDDATWTLTSYLVANGIIVPVSGWIGRVLGRKRYFLLCIAMFTLFSFLCGMATSLPQLVIFRLFQGLFGGGLQPNQQSIILDTFEPQDRGKGFSMVAVAVIFAPIVGPVLGGWLTDAFSWRWVFLINVPIGLFAFVGVLQLVEDPPWVLRDRARLVDMDYIGIALIAVGFGALQFVLDRGEDLDWFGSPQIRICALVAVRGHPRCGRLAADDRSAGGRSARADGPQFRRRLGGDVRHRADAVFQQCDHPAAVAGCVRLHRAARRLADDAGRGADVHADPGVGALGAAEHPHAARDRLRLFRAGLCVAVRAPADAGHRLLVAGDDSAPSRPWGSRSCSCRTARSAIRRCRAR